ncbi:PLP-dependent aminotransferase family protein [Arenimonas donghaensis]|uniref:HTH gntR-type domain-containing protein n=1 Tax=Arenimonas donghaensis DSM 18148 = HO3-R19 TaxID=1121014 RepID=A0A087MKX8_9GAMM|nr:PLP-dependent aminotransferase family protein [Arenimonas donghaensis]KFL37531.1 hypothetical protein N788_09090 [Arenimonas donghaensis DSM 18148 = HO3-R19]
MDDLNIVLDSASPLSLQHQLRKWLVDAIHRGVLRPGRKLPSTRALARRVRVSRNTVSLSYDALLAEGHLVSRARSGVYVAADVPAGRVAAGPRSQVQASPLAARLPAATQEQGFRCPANWHQYPFPFIDGRVNASLLPADEWREALRFSGSRQEVLACNMDHGDSDDPALLEELRGKVLPMRGLEADADQVLVTLSSRQALHLLAEVLVRRGTPVRLEEPVDPGLERRLRERQASVGRLDPDLAGPLPEGVLVVTSARRSVPAGSAWPRRLLAAVAAADGLLIEHDMPPGARDGSEAAPALAAMCPEGRVAYVASLAPVASCGEPLGIVVAAPRVIERLRQIRSSQGATPPALIQRAWCHFIGLGHYSAALQRAGRVIAARRTALRDALNHYLHKSVSIQTQPGASAYWVRLADGTDALDLARRAAAIGVLLEPVAQPDGGHLLCMGVTGLEPAEVRAGVHALSRLVRGDLAATPRHLQQEGGTVLRGHALRRTVANARLLYNTVYGAPCTLQVHADGRLSGVAGDQGEDCDQGRWWIQDGRWYRQWQQWAYGEASGYDLVVEGEQLRFYGEDGLLADTAVLIRRSRTGRAAD